MEFKQKRRNMEPAVYNANRLREKPIPNLLLIAAHNERTTHAGGDGAFHEPENQVPRAGCSTQSDTFRPAQNETLAVSAEFDEINDSAGIDKLSDPNRDEAIDVPSRNEVINDSVEKDPLGGQDRGEAIEVSTKNGATDDSAQIDPLCNFAQIVVTVIPSLDGSVNELAGNIPLGYPASNESFGMSAQNESINDSALKDSDLTDTITSNGTVNDIVQNDTFDNSIGAECVEPLPMEEVIVAGIGFIKEETQPDVMPDEILHELISEEAVIHIDDEISMTIGFEGIPKPFFADSDEMIKREADPISNNIPYNLTVIVLFIYYFQYVRLYGAYIWSYF